VDQGEDVGIHLVLDPFDLLARILSSQAVSITSTDIVAGMIHTP
jgi:hypothetical protein